MRTTKIMVQNTFRMLCNALGKQMVFALRAIALDRNEGEYAYWPKEKIVNENIKAN